LLAPSDIHDSRKTDPDLTEIIDAWATSPDALKAGILAMVRAARM
jgi:hypothetical protein